MYRMTLTNELVAFHPDGIWIQPLNSDGFIFTGSPSELIQIMVFHHDLDIVNARFIVTDFLMNPITERN